MVYFGACANDCFSYIPQSLHDFYAELILEHFTIHCDSSLMAESMYARHKKNIYEFAPSLTHYHRLVERFGLIEDIRYCLTADLANVLPVYEEGKLIVKA